LLSLGNKNLARDNIGDRRADIGVGSEREREREGGREERERRENDAQCRWEV